MIGARPVPSLPFAHLNLRRNPFGELEREERARLAVVGDVALLPGEALQIVGESGRGKTTHLLALAARTDGAVYELVVLGEDRLRSKPPAGAPLFVDEAQRLARRRLEALFARAGTLVLGTHEDLSRFARRPVRTIALEGLAAGKLAAIVAARIEASRRGPGPVPVVPRAALVRLIDRHGDDLRAIEGALYDAVQAMTRVGDVQP